MNKSRGIADKKVSQLPNWLWSNSNVLPSTYRRIWEAVREERSHLGASQGELLVDTKKVFPLLLTSQLPTEVLGYIWGLANQKYAGKLTEQELYVVLALVAVAQTSYPFTNLEVLHLLPGPPEPRLNMTLIHSNAGQISAQQDALARGDDFAVKHEIQGRSLHKMSSAPSVIAIPGLIPNHSHMGETKIDSKTQIVTASLPKGSDHPTFETRGASLPQTDGRTSIAHSSLSADSSDDFSEFQSAPVPQTTPSVPLWDAKQGSAIGSRLANHNLGVKKTSDKQKKISSASGYGSKIHGVSRSVSSTSEKTIISPGPIGGKDVLPGVERLGELFPKCGLKNQGKTVFLKDTVIRNNDPPKLTRESTSSATIDKIEIPPPARQNSVKFVTTIASRDPENSPHDLMNLQQVEDKYSALRVLVEEPNPAETIPVIDTIALSQSDDFGDFVSAEKPETYGASSSTITASSSSFGTDNTSDLFNDFERFRSANIAKKQTDLSNNFEPPCEAFGSLEIGANLDGQSLDEKYDGIVETEKVMPKEDAISVNSIELGNGTISVLTRSNSVPSLDLKSFLSPSADEEQQQVENMHQLIYWEWKQYMESCVLLLQTAANVFGGITSDVVLQEVMASAQGYNFLCNLAEVAAVCRRVNFSHKEMDINIMGFDDLLMDIDRIWAEMEPFYANIPIVTELPVWPLHQSESSACCALCLTVVTSGRIVYNDNNYHVTCANLWLNCVNHNLPTLRYPPSSFLSHSIPIISTGSSQI